MSNKEMMKYENIKGIGDISGFGGGYEQNCQTMLQAGYIWLIEHPKANLKGRTFQNVYGIFEPRGKDAKELEKAILASVDDCTGAMHQAVMTHLFYIHFNGLQKWKDEMKKPAKKEGSR